MSSATSYLPSYGTKWFECSLLVLPQWFYFVLDVKIIWIFACGKWYQSVKLELRVSRSFWFHISIFTNNYQWCCLLAFSSLYKALKNLAKESHSHDIGTCAQRGLLRYNDDAGNCQALLVVQHYLPVITSPEFGNV